MKDTENLPPTQDSDKCKTCGHDWSQHSSHGHKGGHQVECLVDDCQCKQYISTRHSKD